MNTYPLRIFVKRVLVFRLCLAIISIAAVVEFGAYFVQTAKLSEHVLDLGRLGTATLVDKVRITMETRHMEVIPALLEVVENGEPGVVYRAGRFVIYQIYDNQTLADYSTQLLDANLEALSVLGSAIAKRDSDTDSHNYRVTTYSTKIGEAIGLPDREMRVLIKGSFLHDVGKFGIPDRILLKPGKLDEKEFAVMQTHVEKGVDIIQKSSWLGDSAAVVGNHHEKFGGGGYPGNLSGVLIPITARIFAIADVFDALTSLRPYKKPLTFEQTMELLEVGRGKHFDPEIVEVFVAIARDLYDQYAGRESTDLRKNLAEALEKYFSAGMETLSYGKERIKNYSRSA